MGRVMTPKKWAGESTASSETMTMAITIEILWRAGSSPGGGTMAPSNEGEDLDQCQISPPMSDSRQFAHIAYIAHIAHIAIHCNVLHNRYIDIYLQMYSLNLNSVYCQYVHLTTLTN